MDMICRKTMTRCQMPGMCSPHGGCQDPVVAELRAVNFDYQLGADAASTEIARLKAEIDRLRTAEGDAMTYKAGMENVAQRRDQLKAEVERLKHENRLLTEHNEFLASSDSRLAPELRAVKDALGLDFTASVSGEVVPLIERLRKLPTCWTEVLEQSEANDQLLDQVLELSKYADRWKWLEGSADSATWEQIGYQEHMNRHLHVDAAMAKGK